MPKAKPYRVWTRCVVVTAVIVIVYFISTKEKERKFALQRERIPLRTQYFQCSDSYTQEIQKFPQCIPKQCGRFVIDTLIDDAEVNVLLEMAKYGLSFGGSAGGASILDLHSGALSKGEEFISIFKVPAAKSIYRPEAIEVYQVN